MFNDTNGENVYIPYFSSNDLRKKTLFDDNAYRAYYTRTSVNNNNRYIIVCTNTGTRYLSQPANWYAGCAVSPACIIA